MNAIDASILRAINNHRALDAIAERYDVPPWRVKRLSIGLRQGRQDAWRDGHCPRCDFETGIFKAKNWDIIEHADLCKGCVAELKAGRIYQEEELDVDLRESWGYASSPRPIVWLPVDFADLLSSLDAPQGRDA